MWSADGWTSVTRSGTEEVSDLNLWFSDLPTEGLLSGAVVEFTFYWETAQRWEGRNWQVQVQDASHL